jgi:hypothetical protein
MCNTLIIAGENIYKQCTKCNKLYDLFEFTFRNDTNYYRTTCKLCSRQTKLKYRLKNRRKLCEAQKNYYIENKEDRKNYYNNWIKTNKETMKRIQRVFRSKPLNKDKIKQYAKTYRKLHKHQIRKHESQKLKTDDTFRLLYYLRRRHYHILKSQKTNKINKTIELICCTIEQYWSHLEKQFKDGMTRENYGKVWHVDHIIPLSFFDMSDPTEQKLAFHWANTQPLFAKENLEKGDIVLNLNFIY